MGYGNLSNSSDSKEKKHPRFQLFKRGNENNSPSTAPPSRHGSEVRQSSAKADRVPAPAWNVSTVKANTELDRNGFIKYNLSDKDDIFIRAESPDTLFDDTAPVLRKAVPDKFAVLNTTEKVVKLNMAKSGTAPVDSSLAEPTNMFINAAKREVYDYDDVDTVIIKATKEDDFDLDDEFGVEGDMGEDLGAAGMITSPIAEGCALTEASAVEAPEVYRMTDCTDFSELGDVTIPVDTSVISQEELGDDMFEEVTSTESMADFDDSDEEMSPAELAIEAELDAEEAMEATIAAEPEVIEAPVEPNFIDIAMLESPMEEIEAEAELEVIEAPAEPNFVDISMLESPMEEIEAVAEPEVIEAPVEPNFIDISMLESPMEEEIEIESDMISESHVIEVPSESSSHVDLDEVGTESGIISTRIVSMEPAMTSVEAAEPVAHKMSFDYDDYDDFLPPTRAPERRDPKARFRIELTTASETETIKIVGDSAPVFIADTSESSETNAPAVVDDEVSGVMKLTVPDLTGDMESMLFHESEDITAEESEPTPVETCPVHESTVSFTFSRGMESRPSRTGIRFLMGKL